MAIGGGAEADTRSAIFSLLAKRQFPVTDWIRQPKELNYIVEPDVFHDLFVYRLQHRQLPAKLLCD